MENYEVAECSDGEFYYDLNREELKKKLNSIIKKNKTKMLIKGGNIHEK